MNNFQSMLEGVLAEKSVLTVLDRREQRELVDIFKTPQPAVALQQLDDTDMFDKTLQHLLGRRDSSVIGRLPEGTWMVHQLEFDNKFMKLVRSSK